jgi:hypothetical protein
VALGDSGGIGGGEKMFIRSSKRLQFDFNTGVASS